MLHDGAYLSFLLILSAVIFNWVSKGISQSAKNMSLFLKMVMLLDPLHLLDTF